jgi:hypothetical protein
VHFCSSLQAHKSEENLYRLFLHSVGVKKIQDPEKRIKVSFHRLQKNAKSTTSNLDGGVMGEIVFKDLIHFDQTAIPVMISQ